MPEPLKGWPQIEPFEAFEPTRIYPRGAAPLEPYEQRPQVVYVPGPGNQFVGVLREHLPQATVAEPVHVRPDPWPKRVLAVGAVAPLIGWGGSMLFNALAGATTAIGLVVAAFALARLTRGGSGPDRGATVVNNNSGWFSKSRTTL